MKTQRTQRTRRNLGERASASGIVAGGTPALPGRACYKSRMCSRVLQLASCVCLLIPLAFAQGDTSWAGPARELVRRVMERAGAPAAVELSVNNLSSLASGDLAEVRRLIEAEFRARNVEVVEKARAVAEIEITLSENAQGHLWVAEIRQGQSRDIVMLGFDRSAARNDTTEQPMFTIRKKLVFENREPVLDVAVLEKPGATPMLLVLHPGKVALYRAEGGEWQLANSFAVRSSRPFPRDLRGRLVAPHALTFDVYLPGVRCNGTVAGQLGANCQESDDPWPLTHDARLNGFLNSTRNFFNAVSVRTGPQLDTGPFFSAVASNDGKQAVFAGVDGVARVQGGGAHSTVGRWGNDVTGIHSNCGSGWQVLATGLGDWSAADVVQAFEISNSQATAVSAPLRLPGPVVALWPTNDPSRALAVVRNLATGNDEAFHLTITCQ